MPSGSGFFRKVGGESHIWKVPQYETHRSYIIYTQYFVRTHRSYQIPASSLIYIPPICFGVCASHSPKHSSNVMRNISFVCPRAGSLQISRLSRASFNALPSILYHPPYLRCHIGTSISRYFPRILNSASSQLMFVPESLL